MGTAVGRTSDKPRLQSLRPQLSRLLLHASEAGIVVIDVHRGQCANITYGFVMHQPAAAAAALRILWSHTWAAELVCQQLSSPDQLSQPSDWQVHHLPPSPRQCDFWYYIILARSSGVAF
eukprot:TRINITY_DN2916_c0_g1_i1.p1 TRINITY_DN2916_c0_g1~~TRINITY_DN2916_c0_g1_i1.p1  ORF type:complete len:120 (-),score=3.90 TRINITY_DN2916_c0_g1_i1:555-914(-)